jgi:hypothetical protein
MNRGEKRASDFLDNSKNFVFYQKNTSLTAGFWKKQGRFSPLIDSVEQGGFYEKKTRF